MGGGRQFRPLEGNLPKVSEACHPYVTGNHHSNGIIRVFGMKVVVHEERKLHPALPFFGLLAVQDVGATVRNFTPCSQGHEEELSRDHPIKVAIVNLFKVGIRGRVFREPTKAKHATEACHLSQERMH